MYVGDQTTARRHLDRVLTAFAASDLQSNVNRSQRDSHIIRFHTDLCVSARMYLARVLWLQGFSEQAVRAAEMSIEEAQATGHALSLCTALALAACPVALWVGNLAMAAKYARELLDHSRRHYLPLWNAYGAGFHRVVAIRTGPGDTGSPTSDDHARRSPGAEHHVSVSDRADRAGRRLTDAGRIVEARGCRSGTSVRPHARRELFQQALDEGPEECCLGNCATSLARRDVFRRHHRRCVAGTAAQCGGSSSASRSLLSSLLEASRSNQLHPLQARVPVLADDDVVVHRSSKRGTASASQGPLPIFSRRTIEVQAKDSVRDDSGRQSR